ncbi:MAG: hypothetical protein KJ064_00755 [Anaerolineae bacterium]|nr:hypothetical protein [Anaerolineae bacterium]
MTGSLLNPHQRLSLAITLRQVEKTLRGILNDLATEEQGILYQSRITLPEDKRLQVKLRVEKALQQIAQLAERFELPRAVYDNTATLRGPLALLRSDLHDVHARKLNRYGDVNPILEAELDPPVDNLIEILQEITRLAE